MCSVLFFRALFVQFRVSRSGRSKREGISTTKKSTCFLGKYSYTLRHMFMTFMTTQKTSDSSISAYVKSIKALGQLLIFGHSPTLNGPRPATPRLGAPVGTCPRRSTKASITCGPSGPWEEAACGQAGGWVVQQSRIHWDILDLQVLETRRTLEGASLSEISESQLMRILIQVVRQLRGPFMITIESNC